MDIFQNTFLSNFSFKRKDLLLSLCEPTSEYLTKRVEKLNTLDRPVWSHVSSLMKEINPINSLNKKAYFNNQGVLETFIDPTLSTDKLLELLKNLIPWRKGPWKINGHEIDAEWRSNIKYDELKQVSSYFKNSNILDIGGGNGYYSFRAMLDGASSAICLDPSEKFLFQFEMFQKFANEKNIQFELGGLEDVTKFNLESDIALCMGILYHHRDPLGVLSACESGLKPGGLLIMESMTIEDERSICLFPEDRYGKARNVYFLPSKSALISLCKRAGFKEVDVISDRLTTLDEQRTTTWMPYESLKEFLDPTDLSKTIEGYPAPKRTIVVCKKKG